MTAEGPALACGDRLTVNPFTMVTVSGAPLPEYSTIVGYPFAATTWAAIDLAARPLDPVEEAEAAVYAEESKPLN